MSQGDFLDRIVEEMCKKHDCHTLILYGSRAHDDATAVSDYDLLVVRQGGPVIRDAGKWEGAYIDAFIYPENKLKSADLLRVRGGKTLLQKNGFGDAFLARLDKLYARGPKPLPPDELQARIIWAEKMIDRARLADAEGNFRRAWLLTSLLEDYFVLRGRWYEGPKISLKWLREHRPEVSALFERALQPDADISDIASVTDEVVNLSP
jgi:uncharacterized protein